jgi:hypothetical protein
VIRILRRATLPSTLALVALASAGPGCSKEKQSLVLAELDFGTTGAPAVTLGSLTLVATPGPTQMYDLSKLSAVNSAVFGLYVSGDVTGSVKIDATAYPLDGSCAGYKGSDHVSIAAAGVTTQVVITMDAANVCTPSGTGGTGGAAGTSGGGGMSGSPGTGGSNGGTGGSAGSSGATGTAGTGGTAGTTGSAGRGGTTGTAGTGGGAGTTGSAGRGGTTGAAGTGGSAGRGGTTGAGGMAGYPSISACRTFNHAATTGCPSVTVDSVAISPNGQIVATGGNDSRVKIWSFDGRTLTQTGTFLPGFNGYTVVFSPDGTRLAYTSNLSSTTVGVRVYTVTGWDAGTTLQDDGSGNILRGVGFTPDSQRVVSVNAIGFAGGDVFVHNIGGSALPAYTARVANEPYTLAVSPRAGSDGSVPIAVGSYYGTTTVLSLGTTGFAATPKDIPASTTNRTTYTVEFSPDGSQLVTGEDYGAVRFFGIPLAATPTPVGATINFAGGDTVNDVTFAPNGMFLAVGGAFSTKQLSIYNVATHAEVDRATPAADVVSIAFAPNGSAIIAGLDDCGSVIVCN